jgi:signal transduction histidine kinase/ActR/RegA family two-component response regulator
MPLEAVLCTEELARRPARSPDYEIENHALVALAQALADSPQTILQHLTDTLLDVFQLGSVGISLLREDGKSFYWTAISGQWKRHVGGGSPRDFGPCGDVLDRGVPLLFTHPERRYAYLLELAPPAVECLLVPLFVGGEAVGTIWAIAHDDRRKFDAQDLRLLVRLSGFASSAFQVSSFHARTVELNEALMRGAVRQHELTDAADESNANLQASDTAKDQFLAVLSHELRSPLNVIRLWSQILQGPSRDEASLRKGLEVIDRNSKALGQLIEDLLDVHRISTGGLRLELAEVDLCEIIGLAIDSIAPSALEKGIRIVRELDATPACVTGDPARIQQVLWNLLGNAVKFTQSGGQIRVSLRRRDARAELQVIDTGEGISAAALAQIFDRSRLPGPLLSPTHGGLGLGLAISKQLLELHGGTLTAASPGEGAGATFTVSLPLSSTEKPPPRPEQSSQRAAKEQPSPIRGVLVLVVDDMADSLEVVRRVLEGAGAKTILAGSAEQALAALRKQRPDVIVSDLGMPVRDGYDLMRSIRALPREQGGQIPTIALTAYAKSEDRERALQAGFQTHLAKPVEPDRLIAAIAALVPQAPVLLPQGKRRSEPRVPRPGLKL